MKRCGFTLVELLVIIFIIAILAGLLLPALRGSSEHSQQLYCQNNLRNIGLAFQNHNWQYGDLPNAGHSGQDLPTFSAAGVPYVGDRQVAGWAYQILPFIEMQNVWAGENGQTPTVPQRQANAVSAKVKIYFCSSRGLPRTHTVNNQVRGLIDYAAATTLPNAVQTRFPLLNQLNMNPTEEAIQIASPTNNQPPATAAGDGSECAVVLNWNTYQDALDESKPVANYAIRLSDIRDGTSNTLLIGEKQINFNLIPGSTEDDQGYAAGWNIDSIRSCVRPPAQDFGQSKNTNKDGSPRVYLFGSSHPGMMNVVLCDGSVRSISNEIDREVFIKLWQRSDGNRTGDY